MIIKKSEYDPDGWMFEDALHKARYIYPTPDNPNARTIEKHAIQIYDSELLERSMCEAYGNLRPLTYMNVQKYFSGNKKAQLLKEKSPYQIEKHKRNYDGSPKTESKYVSEYMYEFNDIFSLNTNYIIECKTYKSESGRTRQLDKIRKNKSMHICDYYLLALDKNQTEFEVTDFLSLRSKEAKWVREDFENLITK